MTKKNPENKTITDFSRLISGLTALAALMLALDRAAADDEDRKGGLAGQARPGTAAAANAADEFVAGELLVAFRPGTRGALADGVRNGVGATRIKAWPQINAEHWHLPPGLGVAQAIQALGANPNVLYAEPNYIVQAVEIPNDPRFAELWGLHNIGLPSGTPDADADVLEAWQLPPGTGPVVVAVIDTGLDYNHPDLVGRMWVNPREIPGNGIDDDGNGYIDDTNGWDFVNNDNDPKDDHGHGTHVSGTIAGNGNNGTGVIGIAGLNPNVQLMPLKFLDASGWGTTANAVSCVNYAGSVKDASGNKVVRITSNSWGGGGKSKTLESAIANSSALFVAAAGNDGTNTIFYPAGYPQANIIAVAATDNNDALAGFSNFSPDWVDLAAPGVGILSTTPSNSYASWSGTSMATPHVSGVAALLMSQDPSLSINAVKAQILATVDPLASLTGKTLTGGRLNARRALGAPELPPDSSAPAAVTDLAATVASATSVTLTWTAPGNDGNTGRAYVYDLRYSTAPISDDAAFAAAGRASSEPNPQAAGAAETFTIADLPDNRTWYFALKTIDDAGNISPLSNPASAALPLADWHYIRLDWGYQVGNYVSLGVTTQGGWSVAYDDAAAGVLRCAFHPPGTGYYQQQTVGSGGVGASLAYSPNESQISISHVNGTQLYFVTRSTNSGSSWTSTQIETRDVYPHETCLAFAGADPIISYYKTARRSTGLSVARRSGSAWSTQLVDSGAYALYNQLAIDPAGNAAIAYSADANNDGTVDTLKFARWNGAAWSTAVVEAGGFFGTVAINPVTGIPAVAHWNAISGQLRFLQGNDTGWNSAEIVDTATPITGCSLAFGPDGKAYLAYGATAMRLAIRDPTSGLWAVQVMDDSTDGGLRNSLKGRPLGTPTAVAYQGPRDLGFQVGPDPASSKTVRLAFRMTPY